jgi:hypothetical protein
MVRAGRKGEGRGRGAQVRHYFDFLLFDALTDFRQFARGAQHKHVNELLQQLLQVTGAVTAVHHCTLVFGSELGLRTELNTEEFGRV